MSYEKQNFTDGMTLKAEHLNKIEDGIKEIESAVGGSDTLTWDGNTAGKPSFSFETGVYMYKLSDAVPTKEDVANGLYVEFSATGHGVINSVEISGSEAQAAFNNDGFAPLDAFVIAPTDNYESDGVTVPQKGVWGIKAAVSGVDGVYYYASKLQIHGYTGFKQEVDISPIILYADADYYLYADSDTSDATKRITCAELKAYVMSGRKILVYATDEGIDFYAIPSAVSFGEGIGFLVIKIFSTEGVLHTAEYIPPETTETTSE